MATECGGGQEVAREPQGVGTDGCSKPAAQCSGRCSGGTPTIAWADALPSANVGAGGIASGPKQVKCCGEVVRLVVCEVTSGERLHQIYTIADISCGSRRTLRRKKRRNAPKLVGVR